MFMQQYAVDLVTDADGNCTAYSAVIPFGRILQLRYVKTDFANGVNFTVTAETTGATIWAESAVNASGTRAPRQQTHSTAGAAAQYAAGGTYVMEPVCVVGERLKVQITSGGDTKSGTLYFVVG